MELEIRIGEAVRRATVKSPAVVGAHESADVPLEGVEGVNRRHALLVRGVNGWTLHDLDATNGVKVNGERLARADLAPGDEVRIGRARLTLLSDGGPADAHERLDHLAASLLADSDMAAVFADRCRIRAEHDGEWTLDATVDGDRTLGYSARCGLRLPRAGVSSLRALLTRDSGAWHLHDLRSDTGLIYLGKRVASVALTFGDVVKLGKVRLHFELLNEPHPPAPPPEAAPEALPDLSFLSNADLSTSSMEFQLDDTPPAAVELLRMGDEAMAAGKPEIAAQRFAAGCDAAPWSLALRRRLRQAGGKQSGRAPTAPAETWWPLARAQWAAWRALRDGRLEAALRAAEPGLARDPWNRALLLLQAAAYEERGMLDGALWCLHLALRRAPEDPLLHRLLGRLYRHLGASVRSIKHFQKAADALPQDRVAQHELQQAMVDKTIGANKKQQTPSA